MSLSNFITEFAEKALDHQYVDQLDLDNESKHNQSKQADADRSHHKSDIYDIDPRLIDDELLRSLYREYRQAEANLDIISVQRGSQCEMTKHAKEMRNATYAAVQTRLSELGAKAKDFYSHDKKDACQNYQQNCQDDHTSLDTSPSLKKRRMFELLKQRKRVRQKRERSSRIANDTFMAFMLLALFTGRDRAPFSLEKINFSESFSKASTC